MTRTEKILNLLALSLSIWMLGWLVGMSFPPPERPVRLKRPSIPAQLPPGPRSGQGAAQGGLNWYFQGEYETILTAAERNSCRGDDFLILLAIRKAEAGRPGREFGVLHPKAVDTNLDTQAGWAAATVVKNRARWKAAGCPGEFIAFLGSRYCPTTGNLSEAEQRLNGHWVKNVTYWHGVFSELAK